MLPDICDDVRCAFSNERKECLGVWEWGVVVKSKMSHDEITSRSSV